MPSYGFCYTVRMSKITTGKLGGTLPYIKIGTGRPLIFIRTLTPESGNPSGMSRWAELQALKPYAERYTVYAVSRDVAHNTHGTMHDFARQLAEAIQKEFNAPVIIMGISTGGSLALQLAIDYPHVVSRLVLVATSCRLSSSGRQLQQRYASLLSRHLLRDAEKSLAPAITKTKIGAMLMGWLLWLTAPLTGKPEYEQMVGYLRAEDAFDVSARIQNLQTPTLLIAGEQDKPYDVSDARLMTRASGHITLITYPKAGHREAVAHKGTPIRVLEFLADQ